MATVSLVVAGRRYDLACREGEEARFEALAAIVDDRAQRAAQAMGGLTEPRQLLLAALLLADSLDEAQSAAPRIEALAAKLESLADRLEDDASNA